MKIGLITIHKIFNYGSALQTYALQTKLNEFLGNDSCRIINYVYPGKKHIVNDSDNFFKRFCKIILFHSKNILRNVVFFLRNEQFNSFWKKYYFLTEKCDHRNIKNLTKDFDILVCGSDQIWNTRYTNGDSVFLLDFADEKQVCFSYASAIGQSHIHETDRELFKTHLTKFRAIGIRDYAVKNELSNLLQKPVFSVCDPTLLLSKEQWDCLVEQSKYKNKNGYILLYILKYSFDPWPEINTLIESIRKKYNLPVISIYSDRKQNFLYSYKMLHGISVEDFICLIRNSSFVVTTSFHGTCFSIIYKKNFYTVISDITKDSRVYDLLKAIGLENRAIEKSNLKNHIKVSDIQWNEKDSICEKYINNSNEFLKRVLNDL